MDQDVSSKSVSVAKSLKSFKEFKCNACGHNSTHIYPPLEIYNEKKVVKKEEKNTKLNKDLFYNIFLFIDLKNLRNLQNTCKLFREIIKMPVFEHRKQICCFHTKMTYEEALLGVGITIEMGRFGVQYVHSKLDLISSFAFNYQSLRTSLWKEKFTHWVPVYINKRHGKYALDLLKNSIQSIYGSFTPKLTLDLFTKLMNSMVVDVMKGVVHASIKALDGYVMFHRLLIALITEYPELKKQIDEKIKSFIENPKSRRKGVVPSMGDFLPLLTVSSYSWKDVAVPVIQEVLIRNIFWIFQELGDVAPLLKDKEKEKSRIQRDIKFFSASKTSLRLIMFHVYFLKNFTPKKGETLLDIAHKYDENYGFADEKIKIGLQKEIKEIFDVSSFSPFFQKVYLDVNKKLIDNILLDCVEKSDQYKYTSNKVLGWKEKEEKRIKTENLKKKSEIYNYSDDEYDEWSMMKGNK